MRKSIIIFSIIFAVLALGGGTYYAWVTSRAILTPPVDNLLPNIDVGFDTTPSGDNPSPEPQGSDASAFRAVSDQEAVGYFVDTRANSSSSGAVFYVTEDGAIFKVSSGEDERIAEGLPSPVRAVSSVNGRSVLVESGAPHALQFTVFYPDDRRMQALPASVSAALSPDGLRVAYWGTNGDISLRDLFGSRPKTIKLTTFLHYDMSLIWPRTNTLAFLTHPSARVAGELWEFDVIAKTLRFIDSGEGLMNAWSSDGTTQLRFVARSGEKGFTTQFLDPKGVSRATILATFPSKCATSADHIYCAVAGGYTPPRSSFTLDDYLQRSVYARDSLYVFQPSLESSRALLAPPDVPLDAILLRIAQNTLFFINRYDGRVYALTL